MKKPRILISTLCVGVLLFAVFILAVNLYVQSNSVQNRIRAQLSRAVGMPVGVFRTTFSPWGGFRLDRLRIASDVPGARTDFLQANLLEVRCEFLPLFKGRVVLKRIALDTPQFVFQKNASGQFRFPVQIVPEATPPPARPPIPPVVLPEVVRTPLPPPVAKILPDEEADLPATVPDIRKLLLRDGSFRFLAQDGSELLRLEGVRCSLNSKGMPNTFNGVLEIKKAVFLNKWEALDLESSVTLENGRLDIEKLVGEMAGGHLEGSGETSLTTEGKPYNLRLRLAKGQLLKFFTADADLAEGVEGLVNARLDYDGFASQPDKNKGHAELKITRAKLSHLPLLQIIGQLTRSDELGNFVIKKTEIKADILGSEIQVTPSSLQSDHLQVTFSGPIDARQNMNLQAELLVDDTIFKKLPTEARENFIKNSELNLQTLDFKIDGTISSPQTNLVNRLIGDKLQKKLKGFLGSFGKEEETKPEPKSEATPKK